MTESGPPCTRLFDAMCKHACCAVFVMMCEALLSAHATRVHAQDVQLFHPALDDSGFLGLDGTRTPGPWRSAFGLFGDVAAHPVELHQAGTQITPIESRLMLHLSGELGLGGRGALALRVPVIAYQQDAYRTDHSQIFRLADPELVARYRVLGASMADNDQPHDGPGLALRAGLGLPLGQHERVVASDVDLPLPVAGQAFAGDGAARLDVGLLGDFQLLGAGIGGSIGYRHHFWDPKSVAASAIRVSDQMTFAAALKVPIPPVRGLSSVLELRGVTGFQAARDTAAELDLGLRWSIGAFTFVAGGGLGVTRGVGAPDARAFLGAYFVPPKSDQDDDGIDDAHDRCPYLPEDRDGFQDGDGCPDPDNDNDLVPDVDDKCPNVPAEEGRDEDEDGCTDKTPAPATKGK